MKFKDKHPLTFKIMEWIFPLLILILGMALGYGLNVDNVQDNCNEFIIDNYFTVEMQQCFNKVTGNNELILPIWSGDYDLVE